MPERPQLGLDVVLPTDLPVQARDWPFRTYLALTAEPDVVPRVRHHARQLLWDWGLKELLEPVELVVSEIVTNAVRASGGLDGLDQVAAGGPATLGFWLAAEETSVLVLVWDTCSLPPKQQKPGLDADSGRGLLLVEAVSAQWGSFVPDGWPGKVVWALCRS